MATTRDEFEGLMKLVSAPPAFELVLDIIHVKDYLWSAAESIFRVRGPRSLPFVRQQPERILSDELDEAIAAIQQAAQTARRRGRHPDEAQVAIGYFQRNAAYMHYATYLAAGRPIATGIAEGACGSLVKQRMQAPGMRWPPAGAQPILDLRSVRTNGDWDAYWSFHHQRQTCRLYPTTCVAHSPEDQLLARAA
jgi:hypothetical protein